MGYRRLPARPVSGCTCWDGGAPPRIEVGTSHFSRAQAQAAAQRFVPLHYGKCEITHRTHWALPAARALFKLTIETCPGAQERPQLADIDSELPA